MGWPDGRRGPTVVDVLSAPENLPDDVLADGLARGWGVEVAAMAYRPVGFGSHHWEVTDDGGGRRWVSADDLPYKRYRRDEPLDAPFDRLCAALGAAVELRDAGRAFAVAPVPSRDGRPALRVGEAFAVAVYPYVEGRGFGWGEYSSPEHRLAVLDMVVGVHTFTGGDRTRRDDFGLPHRDELEAGLDPAYPESGPYAGPVADLLREHAGDIRRRLREYDEMVGRAVARPDRAVLTHGEPHAGNTMLTPDGWALVDWDTALPAPPERDLWMLADADADVVDRYARATGVTPLPWLLDLYRVRWDLADLAVGVGHFRRPHGDSANDRANWDVLRSQLVTPKS